MSVKQVLVCFKISKEFMEHAMSSFHYVYIFIIFHRFLLLLVLSLIIIIGFAIIID